jgi:hypothetical protein
MNLLTIVFGILGVLAIGFFLLVLFLHLRHRFGHGFIGRFFRKSTGMLVPWMAGLWRKVAASRRVFLMLLDKLPSFKRRKKA